MNLMQSCFRWYGDMITSTNHEYFYFSPETAKHKIVVEDGSEIIPWIRQTVNDGFMIIPDFGQTTIYLFGDAGYMMYLLTWK